ncbi:AAEL002247-PA [Aedes aegypti]|uniref:AAEL002247-PA n=1 Tax=Aedes aegypti TaxID=7159 RepID=Q17IT6_AEDAE|nr:AAEL002247-PA [Aedes aegypti]
MLTSLLRKLHCITLEQISHIPHSNLSSRLFHLLFPDVFAEFDLLLAIKIPPEDGITFVDGSDGFPAFGVAPHADIKSPYRTVLPEKLTEFTIIATVRPGSRSGGYVFSVVNPLDTVVQLGLLLEPILATDQWNITLIYTDANVERVSQPLVSFQIPYTKSWIKLIFKVLNNQVVFYNNCVETETVVVKKEPRSLTFDGASTLYIAQAGPILKRNFEVSAIFLDSITSWRKRSNQTNRKKTS